MCAPFSDASYERMQQGEPGGGGIILSEIIKAGSMGHGTAVPGHYDLDIVVYSDST